MLGLAPEYWGLLVFGVAFALVAAVVGLGLVVMVSVHRDPLLRWANQNGLVIQKARHRQFLRGPFLFKVWPPGAVYRIQAITPSGETKQGWAWVRMAFVFGRQDCVEISWDS
jgi:hypothetical protein